jgi:hypothetical protein
MKIGDRVKCISIWSPHGNSDYLKLGEYYIVEDFDFSNIHNLPFIKVNINKPPFTKCLIAYHPLHFRTLQQERELKLKKLQTI